MPQVCEKIVFQGRVQGVGFRMTAVAFARDLPLSGTVRNLDDGAVELIVRGTPQAIETIVQRLREHFGAFVRNVNRSAAAAKPAGSGVRVVG